VLEDTHQRLADELGSVREIVSRLLRSFEARRWVKLERERVTVTDPKALAALARDRGRAAARLSQREIFPIGKIQPAGPRRKPASWRALALV
jgi:hypothetical protein